MGHDWTALKDYEKYQKFWKNPNLDLSKREKIDKFKAKSEIAYLRRNAWSETIHELYKFLYCENNDNGVSGNGSFVIVEVEYLKEAKEKVTNANFDKEDKKDYLDFLDKCIIYCKDNNKEGVIIHFG